MQGRRSIRRPVGVAALVAVCLAGCGSTASTTANLPRYLLPVPIGAGSAYRIPAASAPIAARKPVAGLRCRRGPASHVYGVHLELFADRLVVPVPAGIGVAPPIKRSGAYVIAGACRYPLATVEPTGVVRVESSGHTLGTLFRVWGQPLSRTRVAGFRGPVLAFLDGRPWHGPPGAIPLARHAEIVIEIGGALPPHPSYQFAPGL